VFAQSAILRDNDMSEFEWQPVVETGLIIVLLSFDIM